MYQKVKTEISFWRKCSDPLLDELRWSTFGRDYSLECSWVCCDKFAHLDSAILLCRSSQAPSGWKGTVGEQPFSDIQVRALAGSLKDIHRVVTQPLLPCLCCVLRDVVLLEGRLSAQSNDKTFIKDISCFAPFSFPSILTCFAVPAAEKHPAAWCCHQHASLLVWYWAGDERCLVSSR